MLAILFWGSMAFQMTTISASTVASNNISMSSFKPNIALTADISFPTGTDFCANDVNNVCVVDNTYLGKNVSPENVDINITLIETF